MQHGGDSVRAAVAAANVVADLVACVKEKQADAALYADACATLHCLTTVPAARAQVRGTVSCAALKARPFYDPFDASSE